MLCQPGARFTLRVGGGPTRIKPGKEPEIVLTHLMEGLDTFYGKDGGPGNLGAMGSHAHGQAMKGGHFFPEENPDDMAALIKQFLAA